MDNSIISSLLDETLEDVGEVTVLGPIDEQGNDEWISTLFGGDTGVAPLDIPETQPEILNVSDCDVFDHSLGLSVCSGNALESSVTETIKYVVSTSEDSSPEDERWFSDFLNPLSLTPGAYPEACGSASIPGYSTGSESNSPAMDGADTSGAHEPSHGSGVPVDGLILEGQEECPGGHLPVLGSGVDSRTKSGGREEDIRMVSGGVDPSLLTVKNESGQEVTLEMTPKRFDDDDVLISSIPGNASSDHVRTSSAGSGSKSHSLAGTKLPAGTRSGRRSWKGDGRNPGHSKAKNEQNEMEDPNSDNSDGHRDETETEKREARLMRNRESAQLSRQRKKVYMDELETRLQNMASAVAELQSTVTHLTAENVNLRRQLACYYPPQASSGQPYMMAVPGGVPPYGCLVGCPPGRIGFLPGANAPPVPIPRLKSNRTGATLKESKKSKASTDSGSPENVNSKGRKRLKKAAGGASVAALALFCFAFIMGPLSPVFPQWSLGTVREVEPMYGDSEGATWNQPHPGARVLMAVSEGTGSQKNVSMGITVDKSEQDLRWANSVRLGKHEQQAQRLRIEPGVGYAGRVQQVSRAGGTSQGSTGEALSHDGSNSTQSVPVLASLVVSRNNQLVKIDGSLIIQAVMAGDKAASLQVAERRVVQSKQTRLAPRNAGSPASRALQELKAMAMLAVEKVGQQNAEKVAEDGMTGDDKTVRSLPGDETIVHARSDALNYLSGLAGPFLTAGMCTEVFQFDTTTPRTSDTAQESSSAASASASGSVASVQNQSRDDARDSLGRTGAEGRRLLNRKSSYAVPLPPAQSENSLRPHSERPDKNRTVTNAAPNADQNKGQTNILDEKYDDAPLSSVVVSVLANPQMGGKGEDGVPRKRGRLSQIFVVVLVNGVKYVTYACMLPGYGGQSSPVMAV